MGKTMKAVAGGAILIGLAVATGGLSVGPTMVGSLAAGTAAIGGLTVGMTAFGGMLVAGGLTMIAGAFRKLPQVPRAQLDRLNAGLDPTAARTGALGDTALPTDVRFTA